MDFSQGKTIKIKQGWSQSVKAGYPWVFKRYLNRSAINCCPGDIVSVFEEGVGFIGKGYYSDSSDISVRLLTRLDEPIEVEFFTRRIQNAFLKRKELLTHTNAVRAVFSEADSLPGLIVDIYGDTAVFQSLTLGIERVKEVIVKSLREVLPIRYVYERSDSPIRGIDHLPILKNWWGKDGLCDVEIFEGKAKFVVDIINGHKTGFYLDQRKARASMHDGICRGKRVLDLFCYCGGFSINAALAGAKSVLAVDIKEDWLKRVGENAVLNGVADKITTASHDVFHFLRSAYQSGDKFDVIILDPPSFLKNKNSFSDAMRGYRELNMMALKLLEAGGVLATFSCSHNMPNEAFSTLTKDCARMAKKDISLLKRCRQDIDHPIIPAIPETNYLKGYFFKVQAK